VPREISSRWLARERFVDNFEVALHRGEVGACLIDLAQGERMLGLVGHSPSLPSFG
jgi:hypothetical protein